jgi:hypothetical protein
MELQSGKPLISTTKAMKALGVGWYTFSVIAEANEIEPVKAGNRRLWRVADIKRITGESVSASAATSVRGITAAEVRCLWA